MNSSLIIESLAILILILANSFFALSEFSIIASRKSKLQQKVAAKKPGAAAAEKLYDHPDRFLASIQLGITLFGTLAGVFGGATLVKKLEGFIASVPVSFISSAASPIAVTSIALLITTVAVVLGELVPKYVALAHPERFALRVSRPITMFIKVSSFFSAFLSSTANLIVRLLGIKRKASRDHVTEDDINQMMFHGREGGVFDATEEKLIKSVFDFADSTVRRVMTPRVDVIGIEINAKPGEIIDTVAEYEYSRYPIYEKSLDNIVGVMFSKDIIIQRLSPELIILKDLCHDPMFVPDSLPLPKLLDDFKRKKKHMAIVLDEHGGTGGIVTMEDVLEELVGEIRDEYDVEQAPLVRHSETVAFADGDVWVKAINELMDSHLPEDMSENIAGLVMQQLGRLPGKAEKVMIGDIEVSAIERDEKRLLRLRLEKKKNMSESDSD
ncbi:MAG: hemolysin family protein [bacterium]|nr:hemolysin family protein [bacterium]